MTLDEYQGDASRTLPWPSSQLNWSYLALGLSGEAGEVCEHLKKVIAGRAEKIDMEAIREELGDVLWYLSALASYCGISLESIAKCNIEKLEGRYP